MDNGSGSEVHLGSVMWTGGFDFDTPTPMQTESWAVIVSEPFRRATNGKEEEINKHWASPKSCLKTNLFKTTKS